MRIAEGFKLRELCREKLIVSESIRRVNFNKIIHLNDSAAYLWESVTGREFEVSDLARLLVDKYEVDLETATRDSADIAAKWIEAGIVEP